MIARFHIISILFLCFFTIQAQDYSTKSIDSLKLLLEKSKNKNEQINLNHQLSEIYKQTNIDSAFVYRKNSIKINEQILKNQANNQELLLLKAKNINALAVLYFKKGEYKECLKYLLNANNILQSLTKKNGTDKYYNSLVKLYADLTAVYVNTNEYKQAQYYNMQTYLLDSINNNKFGMSEYYLNLGIIEYKQGNYQKSKDLFLKTLNYKKQYKIEDGLDRVYTNAGNACMSMGDYSSSLDFYFKTLKIDEKNNLPYEIAGDYNSIGNVYYYLNEFDKSIEYYKKHSEICVKIGNTDGLATSYGNIANILAESGKLSESLIYYQNAINILKNTENEKHLSSVYNNIGQSYNELKEYGKAFEYFNLSLSIKEKLNDKQGIAILCGNIADMYIQKKDYILAISYAQKSVKTAKEIGSIYDENYSYGLLTTIFEHLGNYQKSLEYYKLYKETNDSIYNSEKSELITTIEAQFENDKKQKEIELLNKDKKLKEFELGEKQKKIKQQRIFSIFVISGFILISFFMILLYRQYKAKQKANFELNLKNKEIEQKNIEITTQRNEIRKHRDLVLAQKNEIEGSITYAKRIQEAVLPISEMSRSILPEHFILFKPKDIVSGDFYWFAEINNKIVIAVADCTGHGVPGAFMSMLGISFLNEIVRKQEVTKANQILNELRIEIINALQQKGISGEQKDGMDMSLVVIDNSQFIINNYYHAQFAGANNPLYIVKSEKLKVKNEENTKLDELSTFNFQLDEVKGDKMPIAIHLRMNDFTNHEFELQKGDCLYMLSDGYADQFGGKNLKKFLSRNLKQLLINNSQLPMHEQHKVLDKTLSDWIGDGEQIDDITILGIRI